MNFLLVSYHTYEVKSLRYSTVQFVIWFCIVAEHLKVWLINIIKPIDLSLTEFFEVL